MYEYTAPMLNAALPDDPHALKALIGELVGELRARDQALSSLQEQIAHLKLQIAVLRRRAVRAERLERHLAQLELRLEELQSAQAEAMAGPGSSKQTPPKRPARRPLPAHLPRETQIVAPAETICPACGGALKRLGEDVTEMLEYGPGFLQGHPSGAPEARLWVLRGDCAGPGTGRPIERGLAGPGLLAHVLVSKYADHLPLYRQSAIYAREGWSCRARRWPSGSAGLIVLLRPLVAALRAYVLDTAKLHGDDTPIPVLAPGTGKTSDGPAVDLCAR